MDFLSGNALAVGGIITVAFGALIALLRKVPGQIMSWLLSRYTVSLEILDKDESFLWISKWLSGHIDIEKTRNLSVLTSVSNDEREKFTVHLVPAPGIHVIKFNGTWVIVHRKRNESGEVIRKISESFMLRIISKDVGISKSIVESARDESLAPREGFADIFMPRYGYWSRAGNLRTRPLETMVLNDAQRVIDDLQKFYASEQDYVRKSVPYQRGYLLYGPPGNGKTSFVRAISGHFNLGIYLIDLKDIRLSDMDFQWLISSLPKKSLLLLEDIDQVAVRVSVKSKEDKQKDSVSGEPTKAEEPTGITMSGLLNALDGIISNDSGRVVFMTTNYPELLPSSLTRHGRIDVRVNFPNANQEGIERVVDIFFGKNGYRYPQVVSDDSGMSYAEVQELCMLSQNPVEVFDRIKDRTHRGERDEQTQIPQGN